MESILSMGSFADGASSRDVLLLSPHAINDIVKKSNALFMKKGFLLWMFILILIIKQTQEQRCSFRMYEKFIRNRFFL